jgi:hypothetical protein
MDTTSVPTSQFVIDDDAAIGSRAFALLVAKPIFFLRSALALV